MTSSLNVAKPQNTGIHKLPVEICELVAGESTDDIHALGLVDKRWYLICLGVRLRTTSVVRLDVVCSRNLLNYLTATKSLSWTPGCRLRQPFSGLKQIKGFDPSIPKDISWLRTTCADTLTDLSITSWYPRGRSAISMGKALLSLHRLQKLEISLQHGVAYGDETGQWPCLEQATIHWPEDEDIPEALQTSLSRSGRLWYLYTTARFQPVVFPAVEAFPALTHATMNVYGWAQIAFLRSCLGLKILELDLVRKVDIEDLNDLSTLQQLLQIRILHPPGLERCVFDTAAEWKLRTNALDFVAVFRDCRKLRQLVIDNVVSIVDPSSLMPAIAAVLPFLRRVAVGFGMPPPAEPLLEIGGDWPELERVMTSELRSLFVKCHLTQMGMEVANLASWEDVEREQDDARPRWRALFPKLKEVVDELQQLPLVLN